MPWPALRRARRLTQEQCELTRERAEPQYLRSSIRIDARTHRAGLKIQRVQIEWPRRKDRVIEPGGQPQRVHARMHDVNALRLDECRGLRDHRELVEIMRMGLDAAAFRIPLDVGPQR